MKQISLYLLAITCICVSAYKPRLHLYPEEKEENKKYCEERRNTEHACPVNPNLYACGKHENELDLDCVWDIIYRKVLDVSEINFHKNIHELYEDHGRPLHMSEQSLRDYYCYVKEKWIYGCHNYFKYDACRNGKLYYGPTCSHHYYCTTMPKFWGGYYKTMHDHNTPCTSGETFDLKAQKCVQGYSTCIYTTENREACPYEDEIQYYFNSERLSYEGAKSACEHKHMVLFNRPDELECLEHYLKEHHIDEYNIWIGVEKADNGESFKWLNDTTTTYDDLSKSLKDMGAKLTSRDDKEKYQYGNFDVVKGTELSFHQSENSRHPSMCIWKRVCPDASEYYFSGSGLPYKDAKATCEEKGMTLWNRPGQFSCLKRYLMRHHRSVPNIWIGMEQLNKGKNYKWLNGPFMSHAEMSAVLKKIGSDLYTGGSDKYRYGVYDVQGSDTELEFHKPKHYRQPYICVKLTSEAQQKQNYERLQLAHKFMQQDRNKDCSLSPEEVTSFEEASEFFKRIVNTFDSDKDGKLDWKEFREMGEEDDTSRDFRIYDENKDAKIDSEELYRGFKDLLAQKRGATDEYIRKSAEDKMSELDFNKDGHLTLDEFASNTPGSEEEYCPRLPDANPLVAPPLAGPDTTPIS